LRGNPRPSGLGKRIGIDIKVTVKEGHSVLTDKAQVTSLTPDPRLRNNAITGKTKA
jgi:hypothetical protein